MFARKIKSCEICCYHIYVKEFLLDHNVSDTHLNYLFMLKQPHCDLDDPLVCVCTCVYGGGGEEEGESHHFSPLSIRLCYLIWNGVLDIAQGDGEGEVGEDLWEQEGRVGKSSRESASQF